MALKRERVACLLATSHCFYWVPQNKDWYNGEGCSCGLWGEEISHSNGFSLGWSSLLGFFHSCSVRGASTHLWPQCTFNCSSEPLRHSSSLVRLFNPLYLSFGLSLCSSYRAILLQFHEKPVFWIKMLVGYFFHYVINPNQLPVSILHIQLIYYLHVTQHRDEPGPKNSNTNGFFHLWFVLHWPEICMCVLKQKERNGRKKFTVQ